MSTLVEISTWGIDKTHLLFEMVLQGVTNGARRPHLAVTEEARARLREMLGQEYRLYHYLRWPE